MGAWDAGPFDNDMALDFVGDVAEASDVPALLSGAMNAVVHTESYIEAPDMCEAIAAAALVAARHAGLDTGSLAASDALSAATFVASPELRAIALRTLERALEERDNELYDLWADSADPGSFRTALGPYQRALSG